MRRGVWGSALGAVLVTTLASAQSAEQGAAVQEILVQGSRLPASLEAMPQSIDILKAEDIDSQLSLSSDMDGILANLIPGLSRASNTTVSSYLSLRGRKPVFLVDGIPVTTTLNDTAREVSLVDPSNIARIEVVPGSS